MSTSDEIAKLRQHLETVANCDDTALSRYELRWPPIPPGVYWKARWAAGWFLRLLEFMKIKSPDPWPPDLKHSAINEHRRPLLVWAVGTDLDLLRAARHPLADLPRTAPRFAPVLVTDIANFAEFSRLGCLIEYLPRLAGVGIAYEERKVALLARLYRKAPVLTISSLVDLQSDVEELRLLIDSQG